MGIIALKSSLDTAIRVLDYRLSLATDNITCTIYTYQISLLKEKIAKTHKKLVASCKELTLFSYETMIHFRHMKHSREPRHW